MRYPALSLAAAVLLLAATAGAQGPRQPVPDDNAGFTSIFDGKTLQNWDGDPDFWRVETDSIVGQSTTDKPLKQNTFIIWRGGTTKDFELKLEFKMTGGNSGVQYRSVPLTDVGKWVLKGYQADMDAEARYTGMLYEERGRGFMAERGRFTRIAPDGQRKLIGTPGEGDALKADIKSGDWNQLHIIARGATIMHVINGRIMSVCLDEDDKTRSPEGLLGLQLHTGPPMKVEFRNIRLKKL
ncbi:MAG TPA: DUF1080 domain-containing protein [Bryobacteraceae bacterium]|nr:DUF1080 domain-containing protein [Bryobacteraceae bacterium]